MGKNMPQIRRHDIDWLRIAAVLLLIPFHSSLIFVMDPDSIMYVKDSVGSGFFYMFQSVIHQFHMPLLFVLSGMSSCLALNFRTGKQYLAERFTRLLVPAVFSIVVLIPPMTYITQIWQGREVTFWQHLKGFFVINGDDLAGFGGTWTPAHIWFIVFLFLFSVIALPLFILIKKNGTKGLAKFFSHRFILILPGIVLAAAAALDLLGDKNPLVYFLFFFFGFILMTDEKYTLAIRRDWVYLLPLAVIFECLRHILPEFSEWSAAWVLKGLMAGANRWIFVLALLGFGERFLNKGGSVQKYLSKAAFPIYLLHLPINTLVGFYVIRMNALPGVKYIIIVSVAMVLTLAVYEAVRRVPVLRWLIGIKPDKKRQPAK